MDTICGLFAINQIPTGSQDPFALRRAAIGVINTIRNRNWEISISDLIDSSLYLYTEDLTLAFDYEKTKNEILNFFKGRVKTILQDIDIRYDIIEAIINDNVSINEIFIKAEQINNFFKEDKKELVDSLVRVHNLASKQEEDTEFDEELLEEGIEKELYAVQREVLEEVREFSKDKKYEEALVKIAELIVPINKYFDNIMVLVDDKKIKNNRLSMLNEIDKTSKEIFNIEKIVTE